MGSRGSISASGKKANNKIPQDLSDHVEYREVQLLDNPLSEQDIIDKVGDKDRTGACLSLALAYAANKVGLDVLDFRGGNSRKYFRENYDKILKQVGVDVMIEEDTYDIKAVNRLSMKMEKDKEYILITGHHAAVVRHTDEGYQYLNLQSTSDKNGWFHLGSHALYSRFSIQKSRHTRSVYDFSKNKFVPQEIKAQSYLVSVESMRNNSAFKTLMGYINTSPDQQEKGWK